MPKIKSCIRCGRDVETNQVYRLYCKQCIIELNKQKTFICDVKWEDIDLPEKVEIPTEIVMKGLVDDAIITDYLTDKYCWVVKNFTVNLSQLKKRKTSSFNFEHSSKH